MQLMARVRGATAATLTALMAGGLFGALWAPNPAQATAQWSRKYGEPCSTCHAGFPRLTYYGERFKRNGYQDPDAADPDGNMQGKKEINEDLVIDAVNNWFGARLNVDLIKLNTDAVTIEGKKKTQITIANPNWLQFFVAGSIFKNVSIFIENEFEKDAFKFSWYWLGFHNVAGSTALNFQVGRLSPVDFSSYSNRLRITPALKSALPRVRSSNNKGDDSVDQSRPRPGIQYYGYKGPLVWFAGLGTGSKGVDPNHELNYWGGVRLEVPESMESGFEGSSISFHALFGTDACTSAAAKAYNAVTNNCAVKQQKNDFYRLTPALNVRFGNLDLQAMSVIGHDDNWLLQAGGPDNDFWGFNIAAQYTVGRFAPGIMVDYVEPDGASGGDLNKSRLITPFIRYFARDNFQVDLYAQIDAQGTSSTHPDRKHSIFINFRTMF